MSEQELNIGDYVRTKYGITQYKEYETANGNKLLCMPVKDGSNGIFANIEDIIKSRPSIIDLIEVGDIIKLYSTKQIQQVLAIMSEEIDLTDYVFYDLKKSKKELIKQIEWVITHEQIESMKYKVE